MKFNDAEITPSGRILRRFVFRRSSLDSLSWTCSLIIENLEFYHSLRWTDCARMAVLERAHPPHRFFRYKARRRPLPGSYHTPEHQSCSHPFVTGDDLANSMDLRTNPVLISLGSPHVNSITLVATQQVVPDSGDLHVVSIAPILNQRQPPMISVRQLCDSI
jgi:hypothetical protein